MIDTFPDRSEIATKKQPKAKEVIPSEHDEQVTFIRWFRKAHPNVLIFAIPNGAMLQGNATQRAIRANMLKAEGLTPGIPDLFIPAWNIFIEMKRVKGGSLSDAQKEKIDYLSSVGYQTFVCKGANEAKVTIKSYAGC